MGGHYLGTGTPTSAAFLTISSRITSTSMGRLASRSTSIDGLKSLGFVLRMTSTASSSNKVPVQIPLVRATRIISPEISLTVAFTSSTCGSARSSLRFARETVHKLEYAAFLIFMRCQRMVGPQQRSWYPPHGFSPALNQNIRFLFSTHASLKEKVSQELQRLLLRLSTGKRINSQDDPFLQLCQRRRMPHRTKRLHYCTASATSPLL